MRVLPVTLWSEKRVGRRFPRA